MRGQLESFVKAFLDDLAGLEGAHVRLELGASSWSTTVEHQTNVVEAIEKIVSQAQAHAASLGVATNLPAQLVAFSDVDPTNRRTLAFTLTAKDQGRRAKGE